MQIKLLTFLLLLASCSFARAEFLCSASSDKYPPINDGLIFTQKINGIGTQGTASGHKLLHDNEHFSFWLVAGTFMSSGQQHPTLLDFYVEVRDKSTNRIVRAKSAPGDTEQTAHLELITYFEESFMYQGILFLRCTRHLFN